MNLIVALVYIVDSAASGREPQGQPDEEQVFWLLVSIMQGIFPGYHGTSLENVRLDRMMIDSVLKVHEPALHRHLAEFAILDVAVPRWYVSLFLDGLPSETVMRLWDCAMTGCGPKVLGRAVLSLLVLHGEELKSCPDAQSCLDTLAAKARNCHDVDAVIGCMFSTKPLLKRISSRKILRYRQVERYVQSFEMRGGGEFSPTTGKQRLHRNVTKVHKSRSRASSSLSGSPSLLEPSVSPGSVEAAGEPFGMDTLSLEDHSPDSAAGPRLPASPESVPSSPPDELLSLTGLALDPNASPHTPQPRQRSATMPATMDAGGRPPGSIATSIDHFKNSLFVRDWPRSWLADLALIRHPKSESPLSS